MERRILWVDSIRGLAIILMVVFHFCYDLRYFGYVDWNIPNGPNWRPFRYLILTLFIFTVGVSLSLAHGSGVRWKSFTLRLMQVMLAAFAITVMSLFVFPDGWIYFGILHFIAFASLVGILLVRLPWLSLSAGAVILLGFWLDLLPVLWPFYLFSDLLPAYTEDFVPLVPWLGVSLLGAGLGQLLPLGRFDLPRVFGVSQLAFLGRHGLVIYLAHQPLLFAGFLLFGFLLSGR